MPNTKLTRESSSWQQVGYGDGSLKCSLMDGGNSVAQAEFDHTRDGGFNILVDVVTAILWCLLTHACSPRTSLLFNCVF